MDTVEDVEEASFDVELGKSAEGEFEEFSSAPRLEVVSGFQGGFHVEPALRITSVEPDEFFAIVNYRLEDVDTGESLHTSPSQYRVDQGAFTEQGDAWLRNYDRIILSVNTADEASGRTVEITIELEIEGLGVKEAHETVELVDEVDEFGG